jgi:hypothetical protein
VHPQPPERSERGYEQDAADADRADQRADRERDQQQNNGVRP